nr:hypothetical protein [uncultured Undibacterium sp.]
MAIQIVRISNFGHPDPVEIPSDTELSYKLCMLVDTDRQPKELLYGDIFALETIDRAAVQRGLIKFAKAAQTGQGFAVQYDSKQCHEAFEFVHSHKNYTVWRIRQNDIRIYFVYLQFKNICIVKIDSKRTDKLTTSQESEIKSRAQLAIDNADMIYYERLK